MKPLYFSRHARRRLRRHGISEEEVNAALEEPDRIEPSIKGRTNAFKTAEGRTLRITYREEAERMIIVTVTPRRR